MASVGGLQLLNSLTRIDAIDLSASKQLQGVAVSTPHIATWQVSSVPLGRLKCRAALSTGEKEKAGAAAAEAKSVRLGQSGLEVPPIGIGAWSWGDKFFWNDGDWNDKKVRDAKQAFDSAMDSGLHLFDTAEVYGTKQFGSDDSEKLLGRFIAERKRKGGEGNGVAPLVATKYAALPWRLGRRSVVDALKASLDRLGLPSVDLYQQHWPGLWGNEAERLTKAHAQLAKRGIPLASNQVHYNLLYRLPERNGVKRACEDLGVSLIAYSPLAQGVLSGKYTPENPPKGPRAQSYKTDFLVRAVPLLNRLRELGQKYGKTPIQVSLNWLVLQGDTVPIPGAKNSTQAQEFAGALGWSLSADEIEELRDIAKRVPPVQGFPVEACTHMAAAAGLQNAIVEVAARGDVLALSSCAQRRGVAVPGPRATTRQPGRAQCSQLRCGMAVVEKGKAAEAKGVQLGQSALEVPPIGVGAWSWGDKFFWNDGDWNDKMVRDAKQAFDCAVDSGLFLFDTAEVYGTRMLGSEDSERLLGRFVAERRQREGGSGGAAPLVASKFAPLPWRLGRRSVVDALKASLDRLGLPSVDLYQQHWLRGRAGGLRGVGSRQGQKRMRKAHAQLAKRGIPLASNQRNGVKRACEDLGISLIAYSPLSQGVLSGKYTPENPLTGPRAKTHTRELLVQAVPLLSRLQELGQKYGKTPIQLPASDTPWPCLSPCHVDRKMSFICNLHGAYMSSSVAAAAGAAGPTAVAAAEPQLLISWRVSLNWLILQGNTVPIPGAKSSSQAQEFAGALGWSLSSDEVEELREMAERVPPPEGFPIEDSWV
eukprot:jgi/Mesen1/4701/ME000241S03734